MNALARIVRFALRNSLFLIVGAFLALLWANLFPGTYDSLRNFRIPIPWVYLHHETQPGVPLLFLVNDVLMAFFFALAAKEVWVAMLPGGSLRTFRRAATPVLCALGGMLGPALLFLLGAALVGQFSSLSRGWAIPCATDIAFSYLIARMVFGKAHPAVPFLLLLAIADDAFGLIILALFYPLAPVHLLWLALPALAVALALLMRSRRIRSFWWYLLFPGVLSWIGFYLSGLHPALALLPIIPTLPHGRSEDEPVHWGPTPAHSPLDRLEAWWSNPVEVILGLFGLLNAGVAFAALAAPTFVVLAALLLGKPVGIFLTGLLAARLLGLHLPQGLGPRGLFTLGCAAGIGFTVSLFVITVAFPPGPIQDAAKMGALASALAALTTLLFARLLHLKRQDA